MMNTATDTTSITGEKLTFFRFVFLIAALWNFAGAAPGLFNSEQMFASEFGRQLADPVMIAVYRGAWGTALLYGFGFLITAYDPARHSGVVLMGGMGKALFALNLLYMYLAGWTSSFVLVVIGGDFAFVILFVIYFVRLRRQGYSIV